MMQRAIFAALCGGIFGAGLLISGMTDTIKVQGFLDFLGAWDPTLMFVMGGAILPMAVAWRIAKRRELAVLGTPIPTPTYHKVDRGLVLGSILFGMGWGLVGLCPGPAMASISFGGWGGLVFILAMGAGMVIAPIIKRRIAAPARKRIAMDIRRLTDVYAVSPQIAVADLPTLKAEGFTTIIDNRPDPEIPGDLHAGTMKAAAEALGLTFVINPIIGGGLTMANVAAQRAAMDAATGHVFAYCASGNRSSVVWALALAGEMPTNDLIAIPARFGYQLEGIRGQIEALEKQGKASSF